MSYYGLLKKIIPDAIAVLSFILISFIYFSPAVTEGRIIVKHDSLAAIGLGQEQRDYMSRHDGQRTRWINSIFSGMPTYQMAPTYNSTKPQDTIKKFYSLFLPNYVSLVFIMLIGFYILMRALKMSPLLSALGAIMWAFSSYFFILISAGHIWKFVTLAYIPPTIAGVVLAYRGRWLAGALLVMLFSAFQISANHIQMSYYFGIVIIAIAVAYLVDAIRQHTLPQFAKATAVLAIAALIGVLANTPSLYHTYEYSKETIRGKSELSHHGEENKTQDGLERDYITAWSYGVGETWTLLVPNTKGGASVPLALNQTAMSKARPEYRQLYNSIGQYWGNQPMTSGPVYVGAFVLALFVLGLFIVKGPLKWALLGATVLSVLLSWGHNFMWFTNIFIDYVPMYNKFRAVSSILVVAEFTIPLLAVLALKEIIQNPAVLKIHRRDVYISLALTAGVALLFAVAPKVFFPSFVSANELAQLQSLPPEHVSPIISNLTEMRVAIFTADAWRSFIIIMVGAAALWLFSLGKLKATYAVAAIAALCLADMWTVNKRYLNDGDFTPADKQKQQFAKTAADEYILADTTKHYRVLNLVGSTFDDGITPYWHKCIGGYHPAKLRRYQDLIDVHLRREIASLHRSIIDTQGELDSAQASEFKTLNMLNAKWAIVPAQDNSTIPVENPHAQGNAWFVDEIVFVDNADDEIDALLTLDLQRQAVADIMFEPVVAGFNVSAADSLSSIRLLSYDSDRFVYEADARKDELAVFSEIYYPKGWRITIDGQPAQMIRANYTLRALPIPAGKHIIEFSFNPQSIRTTDNIAYAALLLMLITAVGALFVTWKKRNSQNQK